MIEQENGEITLEPLAVIGANNLVICAIYAKECNLLDKPSQKQFARFAKQEKKLLRLQNQAKLYSFCNAPRHKYSYELPRNKNYEHALELDKKNGNTKWRDTVKLELEQQQDYEIYKDLGLSRKPPSSYKKIYTHFVFDVKHDRRHKARLVASSHLTEVPVLSVYLGVVSLCRIRLALFLAELNGLESWSTNIRNAYLEAKTKEKVYTITRKEFGDLEGHTLLINMELYGLHSSGLCQDERLANCL